MIYILYLRTYDRSMDYFTILVIAIGLSFDTFAVSLSYGVIRSGFYSGRHHGLHSPGCIPGGLTIAGYFLGSIVSDALKATDHWIALGLLSFLESK